MTKVCGSGFHSLRRGFGQECRLRSLPIPHALRLAALIAVMDQVICGPHFIKRLFQSIQDKLCLLQTWQGHFTAKEKGEAKGDRNAMHNAKIPNELNSLFVWAALGSKNTGDTL